MYTKLYPFWISADGESRTLQYLTYDEAKSNLRNGYNVAIKISRECEDYMTEFRLVSLEDLEKLNS